jgi:hypothetical protein
MFDKMKQLQAAIIILFSIHTPRYIVLFNH